MQIVKFVAKFLPYERLKIGTSLSCQEALQRLENVVEPRRFRFLRIGVKPYQGKIEGLRFEVSRIIGYRNSFLPMIKGEIQTGTHDCSICISMRPHVFVLVFMLHWLGGVGLIFLGALAFSIISLMQTGTADPSLLSFTGGLFACGYALFFGGFKVEAIIAKNFFRELFEAKEAE